MGFDMSWRPTDFSFDLKSLTSQLVAYKHGDNIYIQVSHISTTDIVLPSNPITFEFFFRANKQELLNDLASSLFNEPQINL